MSAASLDRTAIVPTNPVQAPSTPPQFSAIIAPSSQAPAAHAAFARVAEIAVASSSSSQKPSQLTLEDLNDRLNQGTQFQRFSLDKYREPTRLAVNLLKFKSDEDMSIGKIKFLEIFNQHSGNELKTVLALIEHFSDPKKLKWEKGFTAGNWCLDCTICLLNDDELKQVLPELQPYYQKIRDNAQERTRKKSEEISEECTKYRTTFLWEKDGTLVADTDFRWIPDKSYEAKNRYLFDATDKFTFVRYTWLNKSTGGRMRGSSTRCFLLGTELYEKLVQRAPKKPDQ